MQSIKSMIGSMKRLKTKPVETTPSSRTSRDESRSFEFERLFIEHWASVYRVLHRLVGDPAEAEDLALEAFRRLYRETEKQTGDINVGGWLYRVATRLGLHSIRSWKRRE